MSKRGSAEKNAAKKRSSAVTPACRGRMRLWIEIDGRGTIGPGKLRLLENIERTRSLAEAARAMKMSYRHAWKHLKLLEQRAGCELVVRRRGGRGGGGAELTDRARTLIQAYDAWRKSMRCDLDAAFRKCFAHFCEVSTNPDD